MSTPESSHPALESSHPALAESSVPAVAAEFHAAWVAELERLEVDVALAEAMLVAAPEESELLPAWTPSVRAPLPEDLEPRARLVLERQLAVAHRLTERLTATGRHQRLTQRIRDNAHPDVPVYVDLHA